jgi:hypothetical protein
MADHQVKVNVQLTGLVRGDLDKMGKWKKDLKMYFNTKYLNGTMDWESGESIRVKVLECCKDGEYMSDRRTPMYFYYARYPERNGFY